MTNTKRARDIQVRSTHLEVDDIISKLRALRVASLESRKRHDRPPKLPSRKILANVAEGLSAALFPNRLGSSELADEGIDHYVGHILNVTLRDLMVQIQHELHYNSSLETLSCEDQKKSIVITQAFAKRLPEIRVLLDSDIIAAYEGDPAARNVDEVLVCYPGIMAITHYRLAHELHNLGVPLIARMISEIAHSVTGIEIHPGAQIGGSFFIDHGTGVVIGETTIIGQNVRLYQAVTLGAKRFPVDENGALVKGNLRHPIVEDDVVIYAGATILGRITIGRGSTIGGNVWLTHSVPPGSNISQAPTPHKKSM
ncbi:serine O-acetyltransferase [Nitrosomonas aestuarii]|uniref:serine O-acetyltransferase n=1 Tax=Nitrosomonas aestuarii TaxID=52441 RepID=A0A1I4EPF7_9PROT|nr:serine O-acetyltransferase EpsC [Nitrosomonas aestuarii]SFL07083.1 serine O-acetyltransferase [Nitrosomonas aestuarii]